MENFEAVVPRVCQAVNPDLALEVLDVPSGDNGDLAVRELRQPGGEKIIGQRFWVLLLPFKSLPGFRGYDGQGGLLGEER